MAALNYSRQRESIKAFLSGRTDHPTADVIYQNIRQQYPNISLGTVYRNLALLSELGEIVKLNVDGGSDRYDYDTSLHHHFVCSRCHCVQDISMDNMDFLMEQAQEKSSARIERYSINFYGLCKDCLEKKENT